MTQTANNYATVLLELGVTREAVDETKEILSLTQDLPKSLKSPVVSKQDKHKLIDRIFPESMKNFLKVVCDYGEADLLEEIFAAYDVVEAEKNGILQAKLEYVLEPTEDEVAQMKAYLAKKYQSCACIGKEAGTDRWICTAGRRYRRRLQHERALKSVREKISVEVITWVLSVQKRLYLS